MYEGKPKKSLNIEWKPLLIKMGILLVVIFIILWIISLFNKGNKTVESNLSVNLQAMKSAATDYFTGSRLPSNVNGKKKVTLGEMFEKKLVPEFRDQNNKSCDLIDSFAEATKLSTTNYTIKVKLVCGTESDYIINTVSFADDNTDNTQVPVVDPVEPSTPNDTTNNGSTNNGGTTSTNKKPTTSTTNKKPTSTKNPITNVTVSKPNNNTAPNSCTYGNKEYSSIYPVAYIIPGDCAVSKNDFYKATYSNRVSMISASEYAKLNDDMSDLVNTTGANLFLETPSYIGVYNKANTGLVGYQILFTMKQKVGYTASIVYQYYIDQNGSRVAVIDKRSSISSNNGGTSVKPSTPGTGGTTVKPSKPGTSVIPSTVKVKSVTMDLSEITLDKGDTHYATVSINPSNATFKSVTWTTANENIATVNSGGKITAKGAGVTTITVTVDGVSASMRVKVLEEEAYTYCKLNTQRVYSTGYIDVSTLAKYENRTSNYTLAFTTKYPEYYDIRYGSLNYDFAPAYDYLFNKNKPISSLNGSSTNGIDPGSATNLKKHSLNYNTITPTVKYARRSGNVLYFDISIKYHNVNNLRYTTPFYTSNTYGVYFVPIYFDVYAYDLNSCEDIFKNEIREYENKGFVKY